MHVQYLSGYQVDVSLRFSEAFFNTTLLISSELLVLPQIQESYPDFENRTIHHVHERPIPVSKEIE